MKKKLVAFILLLESGPLSAQQLFTDVTAESNIYYNHTLPKEHVLGFETGAAWLDMDHDGDLDLYISQYSGDNSFYRNNTIELGISSFSKISHQESLDGNHLGSGVSVADYDNDGDQDIYLANANQDVLLQNDGFGKFSNITDIAFPEFASLVPGKGQTASWGDLNGDGWLDLYISNHESEFYTSQDYLFRNKGGYPVTFTDISHLLYYDINGNGIMDTHGFGFVAALTDVDNDGDLDIYATNDCPIGPEDNKLWLNDKNWNFSEVSDQFGPFEGGKIVNGKKVPDCNNVMGIAIGDPNRDGLFDYYYTNWNENGTSSVFILNDGLFFQDKTEEIGLKDEVVPQSGVKRITWGTVFIDYDLDMYQDIAVASGNFWGTTEDENIFTHQPNIIYHHEGIVNGLPNYKRVSDNESGFADVYKGRTLIAGDYDLDGDQDLFLINQGGSGILYRNNTTAKNWISIILDGAGAPFSNRNGIGAKVKVTTPDGISQHWEMRSGSSLGGGDDIAAYFGLALNESVDIEVKWPSGIIQNIENANINERLTIHEPALRVLTPVLNDSLMQNQTLNITWENSFDGKVNVQLLQKGKIVATLAENYEGNQLSWEIQSDLIPASNYSIQVTCSHDSSKYAKSYGYFSIVEDQVTALIGQKDVAVSLQNYPNPFSSFTIIEYIIDTPTPVQIDLYDLSGQKIKVLVSERQSTIGHHQYNFDGSELNNGVFFYVLTTNYSRMVKSIIKKP